MQLSFRVKKKQKRTVDSICDKYLHSENEMMIMMMMRRRKVGWWRRWWCWCWWWWWQGLGSHCSWWRLGSGVALFICYDLIRVFQTRIFRTKTVSHECKRGRHILQANHILHKRVGYLGLRAFKGHILTLRCRPLEKKVKIQTQDTTQN